MTHRREAEFAAKENPQSDSIIHGDAVAYAQTEHELLRRGSDLEALHRGLIEIASGEDARPARAQIEMDRSRRGCADAGSVSAMRKWPNLMSVWRARDGHRTATRCPASDPGDRTRPDSAPRRKSCEAARGLAHVKSADRASAQDARPGPASRCAHRQSHRDPGKRLGQMARNHSREC